MEYVGDVRLVTPEAVVLDLETASVGSRTFARAIDGLILLVLLILVSLLSSAGAFGGIGSWAVVAAYLSVFALLFGYPMGFELLWNGRTPGKAAMGLRVVAIDGTPVRFRHAMVRAAFDIVEVWATVGSVAILAILFSRRNQRLGDLAGGTVVIHVRSGAQVDWPRYFAVPHGCYDYVLHLDTARLNAELYTLVRETLIRVPLLPDASRFGFASGVATTVASATGLDIPEGMPAETWLACVASAHRMRHPITETQGVAPSWLRLAGDTKSQAAPDLPAAFQAPPTSAAVSVRPAESITSQPTGSHGYMTPG
jgi:uncharacterized RDD family membrane protein YckC